MSELPSDIRHRQPEYPVKHRQQFGQTIQIVGYRQPGRRADAKPHPGEGTDRSRQRGPLLVYTRFSTGFRPQRNHILAVCVQPNVREGISSSMPLPVSEWTQFVHGLLVDIFPITPFHTKSHSLDSRCTRMGSLESHL